MNQPIIFALTMVTFGIMKTTASSSSSSSSSSMSSSMEESLEDEEVNALSPTLNPTAVPTVNPTMNPVASLCGTDCSDCNDLPGGTNCDGTPGEGCSDCEDDPDCMVVGGGMPQCIPMGRDIASMAHLLEKAVDNQHELEQSQDINQYEMDTNTNNENENANEVWTVGLSGTTIEKIWIMVGVYILRVFVFCLCQTLSRYYKKKRSVSYETSEEVPSISINH